MDNSEKPRKRNKRRYHYYKNKKKDAWIKYFTE